MSSKKIEPNLLYRFVAGEGFVSSVTSSAREKLMKGSVIYAIDQGDFADPQTLSIAKRIARESIKYHLSGKELNTKKVVKSLKKMI